MVGEQAMNAERAQHEEGPAEGDRAPEFELPADDGSTVSLEGLRGRRVVLYFYPKDDTSGCTAQACEFRDSLPRFEAGDAVIVGVSPDPVASHRKFKEKYDLNFPLLADEDHAVAEAYGVWKEKSMYGRKYWGVERSTFLIDEQGRVTHALRKVKPKGHAEAVAELLSA
jgi:thioredoxin-dependent peroxiredoxin